MHGLMHAEGQADRGGHAGACVPQLRHALPGQLLQGQGMTCLTTV